MANDTNFVPRLDGTGSLGRADKRWDEVHAKTYHGDGSNLTGITTDQISDPADNYSTTYENTGNALDILTVGNTITVDTGLTYTAGQYITITLRIDNTATQTSRVVSYDSSTGQLQYAMPYSMGAGASDPANIDHEGTWDIDIVATPSPRYTTTTIHIYNDTGNPIGFGASGSVPLGFDLQYEAGDYVNFAKNGNPSDNQTAEVRSYDTETGYLYFGTPVIVSGSYNGDGNEVFTVTLVESGVAFQTQIDNLSDSISAEETARIAADTLLQTQITNLTGTVGADGDSAYDIWLANGNTGTEQEFLNSLVGLDGATGPAGPAGADGDSAYETWLDEGNSGTQQDFLDSLVGATGPQGPQGPAGGISGSITNLTASGHVSASLFYGDGSNLTGITATADMGGTMTAHIIPDTNAAYDLGNAEYKIRHLFLSDNSLWVGDNHKISIGDDGKMKFRKRNGVPLMLENAMANAHGSVSNSVDHFVAQGALTLDGRDSITVDNLRLDEVYLIADQLAVHHEDLFRKEDMNSDFTGEGDLFDGDYNSLTNTPDVSTLVNSSAPYGGDLDTPYLKIATNSTNYPPTHPANEHVNGTLDIQHTSETIFLVTIISSEFKTYAQSDIFSRRDQSFIIRVRYTAYPSRNPNYGPFHSVYGTAVSVEHVDGHNPDGQYNNQVFDPQEHVFLNTGQHGAELWIKNPMASEAANCYVTILGGTNQNEGDIDVAADEGFSIATGQVWQAGPTVSSDPDDPYQRRDNVFATYASKIFRRVTATEFIGDGSQLTGVSTFDGDYNSLTNIPEMQEVGILDYHRGSGEPFGNDYVAPTNKIEDKWIKVATCDTTFTTESNSVEILLSLRLKKSQYQQLDTRMSSFHINVMTAHSLDNTQTPVVFSLDHRSKIVVDVKHHQDSSAAFDPATDIKMVFNGSDTEIWFKSNYYSQIKTQVAVEAKILSEAGGDAWSISSGESGHAAPPTAADEKFGSYAHKRLSKLDVLGDCYVEGDLTGPTITNLQNSIPDISGFAAELTAEETRATAAEQANATAITALQDYVDDKSSLLDDNDVARVEVLTDNTVVRSSTGVGVGNTEMTLTQGSAEFSSYVYINPSLGGMGLRVEGDTNIVGNLQLGGVSVGGLTIAETYIHSTTSGTGAGTYYDISTTYTQLSDNHQITFTAPANGKAKIKFLGMFSGIDSSVGTHETGEEIYVRIKDSNASGPSGLSFLTDIAGVTWNGNKFMQTDESGNHMQSIEANVSGLTPGQSYTYEFHFKKGQEDTNVRLSYGEEYAPTIIRVETLGNVNSFTS